MTRRVAAAWLAMLTLAGGAACGKLGPPVRPPRVTPDQGAIYDAGQPVEKEKPRR